MTKKQLLKQLTTQLDELEQRMQELQSVDPASSDLRDIDNNPEDDSEESEMGFRTQNLLDNLAQNKDQIERTIQRIKDNQYGICLSCKSKISAARLAAVPTSEFCIECQSKLDA